MFKDILTFSGLDYGVALLLTLYLVLIGISIKKDQMARIIKHIKNVCEKG